MIQKTCISIVDTSQGIALYNVPDIRRPASVAAIFFSTALIPFNQIKCLTYCHRACFSATNLMDGLVRKWITPCNILEKVSSCALFPGSMAWIRWKPRSACGLVEVEELKSLYPTRTETSKIDFFAVNYPPITSV